MKRKDTRFPVSVTLTQGITFYYRGIEVAYVCLSPSDKAPRRKLWLTLSHNDVTYRATPFGYRMWQHYYRKSVLKPGKQALHLACSRVARRPCNFRIRIEGNATLSLYRIEGIHTNMGRCSDAYTKEYQK